MLEFSGKPIVVVVCHVCQVKCLTILCDRGLMSYDAIYANVSSLGQVTRIISRSFKVF